jgi:hypothetical protein
VTLTGVQGAGEGEGAGEPAWTLTLVGGACSSRYGHVQCDAASSWHGYADAVAGSDRVHCLPRWCCCHIHKICAGLELYRVVATACLR